ncbi:phosphatidate cytidylyltransferase [Pseudochryseolinea flava]|uniref:Phosphatidate cytidylyltransferase n=1 Tax=Pseudochryseolinea flava TaxID=2059302 RepID=A0A364Y8N1_9BACT|nr:phosphatidate cytidylyltransferase [Pseudochryseolinea flava]RAW03464.1 phosphatidate cytidylyltransferase [Pseudochryseolinea flava]
MTGQISKYNNLTQRIITGLLGSAGIIAGVYFSDWTYFAVFLIIVFFGLLEFYKLAGLDGLVPQKSLGVLIGVLVYVGSFLIEKGILLNKYYILIFPLMSCVYMIKLYKKFERKPFTNIAFTFLGVFYVAVPFALMNIAAFDNGNYNYEIIWGCLFILWASDTGAYFAGTYLGKRKLFERISPKKSWEGFIGGALLALAFAYGLAQFFHTLSLAQWLIIGVIIIVGGTFGDLVESLLKRSIEIKDSGSSLPGHGGFLDRFDGLLISAPFIVAYLEIF